MINQFSLFDKPSFFNTPNLKGEELEKKELSAKSLEAKILKLLEEHPYNNGLTRGDVYMIFGQQYTETSCGRALTNLSDGLDRRLYKTQERRPGLHGISHAVYKMI